MLGLYEYTPRHPAYSGSRCGCAEDRSCTRCDGTASDAYAVDRLSPADLSDLNRQLAEFDTRMQAMRDGTPTNTDAKEVA
jgi:hypothetical protein